MRVFGFRVWDQLRSSHLADRVTLSGFVAANRHTGLAEQRPYLTRILQVSHTTCEVVKV